MAHQGRRGGVHPIAAWTHSGICPTSSEYAARPLLTRAVAIDDCHGRELNRRNLHDPALSAAQVEPRPRGVTVARRQPKGLENGIPDWKSVPLARRARKYPRAPGGSQDGASRRSPDQFLRCGPEVVVTFWERACGMTGSAKIGIASPARDNCARIRRAARNVTRFYDACLAPVGITDSEFTLLDYLKHQGSMRISRLAEILSMDRTTLGHNLRPLERDGLLEIVRSDEDRRARVVTITAAGLDRIKKGCGFWDHAQRVFECAFGASKAAEMRRMMDAAADVRLELPI
jgi:DNA-binding MarR family transcriptional regulator